MVCGSYDLLPFIDVDTDMQELPISPKKLHVVNYKSCDLCDFKIRVLRHDTLLTDRHKTGYQLMSVD